MKPARGFGWLERLSLDSEPSTREDKQQGLDESCTTQVSAKYVSVSAATFP